MWSSNSSVGCQRKQTLIGEWIIEKGLDEACPKILFWPKYTLQKYCQLFWISSLHFSLCPSFIFDGNLANLSSFPRYNSFSVWPLKLFENSIQLHRIENWLKSWRLRGGWGESGRDSYIYHCPTTAYSVSNRQIRKIAKHESGIVNSVSS